MEQQFLSVGPVQKQVKRYQIKPHNMESTGKKKTNISEKGSRHSRASTEIKINQEDGCNRP
jgi:hypothetical protein